MELIQWMYTLTLQHGSVHFLQLRCYLDGMVLASVFHGPKIIAMKGTLRLGTEHAELVG